jgi:integrase
VAIRARKKRDGKTVYDVMLRRPDGGQYSKTFPTKKQAEAWQNEQRVDRVRDSWVDPGAGRIPLGEYAREWLAARTLAPRTREVYESQLKHILGTFADTPLNAMNRREVRIWHTKLTAEVSAMQAAKCYRLLMGMLNTAAEDELIGRNRCRIKGAAAERSAERPLIPLERAMALAAAIEPRYQALVLIAMGCGLRMGELLGLTRADVDLLHRRVIVTKQRQELAKVGITIRPPKTDAGVRAPEFPKMLTAEIQAHLDTWVDPEPEAPLFPGPKGGLRRATVYKAWHKALAAVGLPDDIKPHDLRHLSNTLAAQIPGVTVKDLMARMGHKSEQAALRYLHASAEADATMAQGLDAAFRRVRDADSDDPDEASNETEPDADGPADTATDVG